MTWIKPQPRNDQEAFNNVWQHFIVERYPFSFEGGRCLYRSDDGNNGCAIGCQISDKFLPELAIADNNEGLGMNIDSVLRDCPALREYFSAVDTSVLRALQEAHDRVATHNGTHENLEVALRRLAPRHGLQVSV